MPLNATDEVGISKARCCVHGVVDDNIPVTVETIIDIHGSRFSVKDFPGTSTKYLESFQFGKYRHHFQKLAICYPRPGP